MFAHKKQVKDKILEVLFNKDQTAKSLKKYLEETNKDVSIQGIYKALSNLVDNEVVIKVGFSYALSEEWRSKMIHNLTQAPAHFEIEEGESVSFVLSSLIHLDKQWKNIVLPLQMASHDEPIFLYNQHEVWVHLNESRKESEVNLYESYKHTMRQTYTAIGGQTIHDKQFKKAFQNKFTEISLGTKYFPDTDYPTVVGNYVITTRLSKLIAKDIEVAYLTCNDEHSLETRLQEIGATKKKVTLSIENNKQKAMKLRKKISKEFLVPKSLVDRFALY